MTGQWVGKGARRAHRTLALSTAAALVVLCGLVAFEGQAMAGEPVDEWPAADLSGPVVVGSGFAHENVGRVDVWWPSRLSETITPTTLGVADPTDPMELGSTVATRRIGDLGYVMVVTADSADDDTGRAWVVFPDATKGYSGGRQVELTASLEDGEGFGFTAALSPRSDGRTDIWVGSPGRTVSGRPGAGALYRYVLENDGTIGAAERFTQNSPGVPGTAETGDNLGWVLAPALDGVVAGIPYEDIGSATDAGQITRLYDGDGTTVRGAAFDQGSPGVSGTAEVGDRFGWSVAQDGQAVGVPGEDIGKSKDAGSVQVFTSSATGTLTPGPAWTQDSPGVPNSAEKGDLFGFSVSVGKYICNHPMVAAGSPGETLNGRVRAGSVTVLPLPGANPGCVPMALHQSGRLPGAAEAYDQVGWSLGTVVRLIPGDPDGDGEPDRLLIGVPGESVGTADSTGRVVVWRQGDSSADPHNAFGELGPDATEDFFGSSLSAGRL